MKTTRNASRGNVAMGIAIALCFVGAGRYAPAHAGSWNVSVGAETSRGDYGGQSSTDITSVPFSVRYVEGPWTFRVGSSWLSVTGEGSVVPVLGNGSSSDQGSGGFGARSTGQSTLVVLPGSLSRNSGSGSGSGSSGSGSSGSGSSGSGGSGSGGSGSNGGGSGNSGSGNSGSGSGSNNSGSADSGSNNSGSGSSGSGGSGSGSSGSGSSGSGRSGSGSSGSGSSSADAPGNGGTSGTSGSSGTRGSNNSGSSGSGNSGSGSSGSGSSGSGSSGSGGSGSSGSGNTARNKAIAAPVVKAGARAAVTPVRKAEPIAVGESTVVPTGTTARTRTTESGMGDIIASAAYRFYKSKEPNAAMDLTFRMKFGTASVQKGLGSGRNDFAIQWSGFREWKDWGVFASAGYKWIGGADGVDLRNVTYGGAGVSYRAGSNSRLEVGIEGATSARPGGVNPLELIIDYRHSLGDRSRLSVYVSRGLSKASADLGLGVSLNYYFD